MKNIKTNISVILFFLMATNFAIGQTEHICDYSCSPHRFVLGLHAAPLMTKLQSDIYSSEAKNKFGYAVGADISYYFFNNGKFKSKGSLGFGLSKYNSQYNLTYSDSIWTFDVDNQDVLIKENLNEYVENQGILFLDIPVKLGLEYSLSPRFDVYLNLGFTYGMAIKNRYDNAGILTRTGYYPDFNALLYDIDVEGSPYFYPSNKTMTGDGEFIVKNNTSIETVLGLKYKLNLKWSLFGGFKYMYGFQDIKEGDGMMNQVSASEYQFKSITNRNDKITSQAIGLELGLAFNLGKCKNLPEEIEEPLVKNVAVNYTVINASTSKPVKASIIIKENGQIFQDLSCDENGQAKANLQAGKTYDFEYQADNYLPQNETISLGSDNSSIEKNISLAQVQPIIIEEPALDTTQFEQEPVQLDVNISVLNSKTGKPIKATIELKEDGQTIQTIDCNDNGLSQIRIEEHKDYAVTVNAEGYLYQYDKLDFAALDANPNKEFKLDPIVSKETNIELRPLTFQSGLGNISDESIETLNIILRMLKENPTMQIEVSGHADNVGNKDSNQRLSLKRAQTIVEYLVAKGANAEQLKSVGFGSERPVADNFTAEGRSKNRRVEFKVVKY